MGRQLGYATVAVLKAIAAREGRPRRRYYRLTSTGKAALAEAIRCYAPLAADGWPGDAVPEGR